MLNFCSCFFSYGFLFHHLRPFGYLGITNIQQALIFYLFISVNVQVTHLLGVLGFGGFCFLFGASKLIQIEQCSGFPFSLSLLRRFNAFFIGFHFLLPSFFTRATSCSLGILFVLCRVCSSPLDILQVQEMALLSPGK